MAIAAATIGAGVLGAGSSLLGSGKASSAAKDSANLQKQIYLANVARMAPFVSAGQNALTALPGLMDNLGTETEAQLEATPGYQFIRDQGLKSVQSAVAARGLGVSGAAMKGAASYATGLADQTYQQIFNQQQQKVTNALNLATIGANAGTQTGSQAVQSGANQGNALTNAGVLQGTGDINATNALTSSANSLLGYYQLQSLLGKTGSNPTAGINTTFSGFAPAMTPGQQGVGGFVAPTGPSA